MSTKPASEMTWTKAVLIGMAITVALLVGLGFIPSFLRYWWAANSTTIVLPFLEDLTGYTFKDTYTMVRIHDAISMGYQTTVFVIPVAATYILMERRRKRLGQRGSEAVKGYLPGK